MNGLSWLIYWADVVGAINGLALFLSVVGFITMLIGFGIYFTAQFDPDCDPKLGKWVFACPMGLFFFMATLTVLAPAKETVYAIAASEVGESALKSPTGNKAVAALNAWLDKQIQPPKEETEN